MSNLKHKILIIDGHSLAYRVYYAFPKTLTLDDGRLSNVLYGFLTLLFRGLEKLKPDYLCICFDRKEKTFRHEMYPEYKAHRPPSPDDFREQIPILKEILHSIDVSVLDKAGYEADDLMGTLASVAESNGMDAMLLTGDKDFLQLATESISILFPAKGKADFQIYNSKAVLDTYGLTPDQMIDLKSLQGDSSDNIPGVAGIGPKTATNLLLEFHNLKELYNNLEKVSSANVRKKLEQDKDKAFLSYDLGRIDKKVPIEISLEEFKYSPDWKNILDCFRQYNFLTLMQKYQKNCSDVSSLEVEEEKVDGDYQLIESEEELALLIPKLKSGFAIDLETTSLDTFEAQIVGVAISFEAEKAFYIPLNEYIEEVSNDTEMMLFSVASPVSKEKKYQLNPILKLLKPILENPDIPKYAHNAKYEYKVFLNYDIELKGISFDTMLAAYLLFPGERIGLKELVKKIFKLKMTTFEEVVGKGKAQIQFSQVSKENAVSYAGADADLTFRLKNLFQEDLKKKELEKLFYEIEMPLFTVLAKMEYTGVCINNGYLNELDNDFSLKLETLSNRIFVLAGCNFNINSPKQLAEILFDKLGLPVVKKTKTGRSTDASVLESLKPLHEIAEKLLSYRTLEKLRGTYVRAFPQLVEPKTNRVHTSFNQAVTLTGRLSSSNPNLQNIPIKTEDGRKIRAAIIPSTKDGYILSADYSQIELRVMAHLSHDENMIKAFNNDEDIHSSMASIIFDILQEDVSSEQRSRAKAVNFGIIYGQSSFGLAQSLGITRKEAAEIIEDYFIKFSRIKEFMETTIVFTENNLLVKTEFGRIRPLLDIKSSNRNIRNFNERAAVNTRVQGTAADIIKIAMINIQKKMEQKQMKSKMIIQVHDELVFDVVASELEAMKELVKVGMEQVIKFSVPLKVDISIGKNWNKH
jgi:DNA polymerase I